jgi:LmbE family N-acetylglucosaminyl deacetylase
MGFKLLGVLAHPDDESLGFGGTFAKYAAEGIETYLVTATRGECGRFGARGERGDPVEVGRVREAELRAAAAVLSIREVSVLGFPDGAVDKVPAGTAIRAIVPHIRRIQPDVIVTFGPEGAYGHPDHIAISQFTTAATVCAADCGYRIDDGPQMDLFPPHRVAKLYYLAWRKNKWEAYQAAFRKLTSMVDGAEQLRPAGCRRKASTPRRSCGTPWIYCLSTPFSMAIRASMATSHPVLRPSVCLRTYWPLP